MVSWQNHSCLTVSTRPCKAHLLVTDVLTTSDNILGVYRYQCQRQIILTTSYPTLRHSVLFFQVGVIEMSHEISSREAGR